MTCTLIYNVIGTYYIGKLIKYANYEQEKLQIREHPCYSDQFIYITKNKFDTRCKRMHHHFFKAICAAPHITFFIGASQPFICIVLFPMTETYSTLTLWHFSMLESHFFTFVFTHLLLLRIRSMRWSHRHFHCSTLNLFVFLCLSFFALFLKPYTFFFFSSNLSYFPFLFLPLFLSISSNLFWFFPLSLQWILH